MKNVVHECNNTKIKSIQSEIHRKKSWRKKDGGLQKYLRHLAMPKNSWVLRKPDEGLPRCMKRHFQAEI